MALSGSQITRVATGGAGAAYAGFTAKAESSVPVVVRRLTRTAAGGPGRAYLGFEAKAVSEQAPVAAGKLRGFIVNVGRMGLR